MRRSAVLLVCLVSGAPWGLAAQASVAGTWFTEFDAQVRVVNGVMSTTKGHAKIELTVSADSIHGTWQNLTAAGAADGPVRALAGTVGKDSARIQSLTPSEIVQREMDGETHTKVAMHYTVAMHGDSLVGTEQWMAVDHATHGSARRFTATRKP